MSGVVGSAIPSRRGALFTDLYELVMAQVYVAAGMAERRSQFDYFFRSNPDYGSHQAGFCVAAGLGPLLEWMATVSISAADVDLLVAQKDPVGEPRFSSEFLEWLAVHGHFGDLEVRGVPEGRVVHPRTPILTVTGPLACAQLLETALLNHCNYPTLIATKAARIAQVAGDGPVLEFGMRRGPGVAVNDAARAALIGGCSATSNVEAAAELGLQPKGTHAHSMVQAYLADGRGELAAFRAFAQENPDECVLLVDTIDTLRSGVPNAVRVFEELRAHGHSPIGIRLDSGDLAHLAVAAAVKLDEAGFSDVGIVLSGDLDEVTLWQVLTQVVEEAQAVGLDPESVRRRLSYGVGTKLITSAGDSALGGVYKLTALDDGSGSWQPAVKLSENPSKVPITGPKRLWRLYDRRGRATMDLMTEHDEAPFAADGSPLIAHHPVRAGVRRELDPTEVSRVEELHEDLRNSGAPEDPASSFEKARARCGEDIAALDMGVRRLVNPHRYHVSLSDRLHRRQQRAVESMRLEQFRPGADIPAQGG